MPAVRSTLSLLALVVTSPIVVAQAHATKPHTRTYFVAADEIDWNYAPSGANAIAGKPFAGVELLFAGTDPDHIGLVYRKAVYREYTDSTFTTLKPRAKEWEHLGIVGPLLRAEVGDTIRVIFRNNAHQPYSMHPHGVFYAKSSEGAEYADGTPGGAASGVIAPGATTTYVWPVPERAGPAAHDQSSVLWMYHSHTAEDADLNTGLVGPIIVTARGKARADGSPVDVDREIVAGFLELDENLSPYFDANIAKYVKNASSVKKAPPGDFLDPFYVSNLRETINGYIFGNGPMFTMKKGERVRWYLFADANFQVHAPHWHGNTVTAMGMRTDVVSLTTMGMVVADMVPDDPGVWLFHCHVGPHLAAGMSARYQVTEK